MGNAKFLNKEKNRYLLGAVLVIIVLLLIVLITISASNEGDSEQLYHEDHGSIEEEVDNGPFVTLQNLEFLDEFIGTTGASAAMNFLQDLILGDDVSQQMQVYTASMPSSSLIKTVYFPYNLASFLLEVSDGRVYNVQVALENEAYFGLFVKRLVPEPTNSPNLYVVFLKQSNDSVVPYDRDYVINGLLKWAGTVDSRQPKVTTRDLF